MSDQGTPERVAGHDAGHRWAAGHFQHEKAALGRLLKFRDAALDAGGDLADRLRESADIPARLYEVMRKAAPATPAECAAAWREIVGGTDGHETMRDPQFAAGFVEGAAEVWQTYLEDRRG